MRPKTLRTSHTPRSDANWRAERTSGTANETLFAAIREGVTAYCAASHNIAFDPLQPIVRLQPNWGRQINDEMECLLTPSKQGRKVRVRAGAGREVRLAARGDEQFPLLRQSVASQRWPSCNENGFAWR